MEIYPKCGDLSILWRSIQACGDLSNKWKFIPHFETYKKCVDLSKMWGSIQHMEMYLKMWRSIQPVEIYPKTKNVCDVVAGSKGMHVAFVSCSSMLCLPWHRKHIEGGKHVSMGNQTSFPMLCFFPKTINVKTQNKSKRKFGHFRFCLFCRRV